MTLRVGVPGEGERKCPCCKGHGQDRKLRPCGHCSATGVVKALRPTLREKRAAARRLPKS